MSKVSILPNESPKDIECAIQYEKNNLRKFFAGLTATTFGVIVALHPNVLSNSVSGWFYVLSVILNALSAILLIGSLFGQYKKLKENWYNVSDQIRSTFSGKEENPKYDKYAKRFHLYAIIGIIFYIFSILSACTYLVLDICGK